MRTRSRYFDWQMGLLSAGIMGGIVYSINHESGWQMALVAASKQGLYTFIFSGLIIRLCERISIQFASSIKSLILATIIPATLAVGATFLVHSMKGTPKPVESTVPTILISVPGFVYIARKKRRNQPDQ